MRKRELKNMEWGMLIVVIVLSIIGLVALFSATQETGYDEFKKQIIWFIVSTIIMVIVMLINYESLVKLSPIFYGIFILLLIAVLFTKPVNGATSWFNIGAFSFQPSEFAKIALIIFLACIVTKQGKKIVKLKNMLLAFTTNVINTVITTCIAVRREMRQSYMPKRTAGTVNMSLQATQATTVKLMQKMCWYFANILQVLKQHQTLTMPTQTATAR